MYADAALLVSGSDAATEKYALRRRRLLVLAPRGMLVVPRCD